MKGLKLCMAIAAPACAPLTQAETTLLNVSYDVTRELYATGRKRSKPISPMAARSIR